MLCGRRNSQEREVEDMNSRQRVLTALNGKIPDRVPFLDLIDKEMQIMIMGRENFDKLEITEEMQMDAIQCDGFFPPIFADMEKVGYDRSVIKSSLIKTRDDLALAKFPVLDEKFFEAPERFIEQYGNSGFALYFRTRMGCAGVLNSMGIDGFSLALADDPYVIETLMDMYVEWVIELLDKVRGLGFDFCWFADDIAYKTTLMMSPQIFREIFLCRMRKVAEHIHLPWVYHSDGNILPVFEDLLSLGMNGINPIEPGAMDIEEIKEKYGHEVCLIGNIDLHYTLTRGTPEEVEAEVRNRIEKIGRDGGYIISSSNSITNYCKLENVIAMRDAVVKYRSIFC